MRCNRAHYIQFSLDDKHAAMTTRFTRGEIAHIRLFGHFEIRL